MEVDLGSYKGPVTGKTKRNRKYRGTKAKGPREADTELAKFLAEVTGDGYYEPEKIMFIDFVNNEWLLKHAEKHLSHTTLENYIGCLEKRILPSFQYLQLDQIKPVHILDFLHNIQEDVMRLDGQIGKLSSSQIFYHYRVLNNIFNFAQKLTLIKENPVKSVDKPKVEYKESEVYTLEEASILLKCLELESDVPHWQIIIKWYS